MKGVISFVIFVRTVHIFAFSIEPHNFTCPLQAHWKFLAYEKCNSTLKYFCLYNNVEEKYVEGCDGPDWDRKGSKRIYAGDFTRANCTRERFQPFKFRTNESMSDCIYAKSICSENGQIVYIDDSRKDDRTCRCDYRRNYSFVKTPRHLCYCIPTEEDCSCYIKSCPENFSLSADYNCTSSSYQPQLKCKDITRYSETSDTKIHMEKDSLGLSNIFSEPRWNDTYPALIMFCLCFITILVAGGFFFAVLFHNWTGKRLNNLTEFINAPKWLTEKLQSFKAYIGRDQPDADDVAYKSAVEEDLLKDDAVDAHESKLTKIEMESIVSGDSHSPESDKKQDNGNLRGRNEQLDVEVHQPSEIANLTTDEINYLRIIHLLFRVVCPVVRITFNHEIQPDQLRKTLIRNKSLMEKKFRKKEKIINNDQWDLLYKDKTVTSEFFDVRLMIYLLCTLANFEIGNLYPVQSDTKISAMLSRIKFIRNEATQSFEGKLSEDLFNKYWDDIGQAVFKLVSSHGIANYKEKEQLIRRLLTLNPIDIDTDKLCVYIVMSEVYPAKIIQQLISEYCNVNGKTIEQILVEGKHDLYHKRIVTDLCCECNINFATFTKVIPEKQWESMYEINKNSNSHVCPSQIKKCSERFIPKAIDTSDLSVTVPLVLNIPSILKYIVSRLYTDDFCVFMMNNKHTLYHYMVSKRCCECKTDPTEKTIFHQKDWNKLFEKENNISCQTDSKDCCCQYKVQSRIEHLKIDETLLSKIFFVVGPISVLNNIGQDAFLYFLNWTVDSEPLQKALKELLNIIDDKNFCPDMLQSITSCNTSQLNKTITENGETCNWFSRHVRNNKSTLEPRLRIIVLHKDDLTVEHVHIPKDFRVAGRIKKITDISIEENNFLVVAHGLTKIVFPLIKKEFETNCQEICMAIFNQQGNDSFNHDTKCQKKKLYLMRKQQELFATKEGVSKKRDLKLMIFLLKWRPTFEGKENYDYQLDVIDKIRREIAQSNSGTINDKRFNDIIECITKAILPFGGEKSVGELLRLRHVRNILEKD